MPKIILSRKGFDSTAGGIPSPVIDNIFLSLPIPEGGSGLFYKDLNYKGIDLLTIIRQLGAKFYSECHMDPNINPSLYGLEDRNGWSPAFGQHDNSLSHLLCKGNEVKEGDVFLFLGRFRHAEVTGKEIWFLKSSGIFHAIFGFMEVGKVINIKTDLSDDQRRKYFNHPHYKNPDFYHKNSTLFIPAEKSVHGFPMTYGTLNYSESLVLSKSDKGLHLPYPFHGKEFTGLKKIGDDGFVNTPGRGQEFIVDSTPEMIDWIKKICL